MNLNLNLEEVQKICTDMLRDVVKMCDKYHITYYAIYGTLLGTIRHSGPIPWDYDIDLYVPENELSNFLTKVEEDLGDKYWIDYRNNKNFPQRAFPRIGIKGYETEILHIDIFRMSGLPDAKWKHQLLTHIGRSLFIIWKAKTLDINFYYPDLKRRMIARTIRYLTAPLSLKLLLHWIDALCGLYPVMSTSYVGRVMGQGAIFPTKYFQETELHDYVDFKIRIPKGYDKLLKQMYGDYHSYPPAKEREVAFTQRYIVRSLGDEDQ